MKKEITGPASGSLKNGSFVRDNGKGNRNVKQPSCLSSVVPDAATLKVFA
jgi:hypothetical protein